jgi:hypothetical protein
MSLLICSSVCCGSPVADVKSKFMFVAAHTPVVVNSTNVSLTASAPMICAGGGTS